MLAPKRQKYRKQFRGVYKRIATKANEVNFGQYGIKAAEAGWIKERQIEAARVILARSTRKNGKFWIRIFPDKPLTQKPQGVTMGAGKGEVIGYAAVVSPGRVLFEIDGLPKEQVKKIFKVISSKLAIQTIFTEKKL